MNILATVTYQVPSIISVPVGFGFLLGIILGMVIGIRKR